MKRLITLSVLSIGVLSAKAQIATMSIGLQDALSFTINQPHFTTNDIENNEDDGLQAIARDHIVVVSSRGYVVKAIAGGGSAADVKVTPKIGETNLGNTKGLYLATDVPLPPPNGIPATVISAAYCSWNGRNSANKFDIAYQIGSGPKNDDEVGAPEIVPVIFTVLQP